MGTDIVCAQCSQKGTTVLVQSVMLKYAGEYCEYSEYGEPYGEAGVACQSLVAVIRSRDAGVK